MVSGTNEGSPFAPHTAEETAAMLDAVGVDDEDALFDIPPAVRFTAADPDAL